MLKILVVETADARRAELFDAICELPGIQASAVGALADARRILAAEPIQMVAVGALPDAELEQLMRVTQRLHDCGVINAGDPAELAAQLEGLVGRGRGGSPGSFRSVAARSKALALERASPLALAQRLRSAGAETSASAGGMQTVVLQEWLPAMCAGFARLMPAYVELVPIISGDTPPVRCVPDALEHAMLDIVLEAAAELPWGGTIWLTTEHVSSDTVRIDVLENGRGTGQDLMLRTSSVPAAS